MINLLPPELKQEYRFARRNRRLVRWCAALGLAIVGMAVLTAGGLLVMNHSIQKYEQDTARTQARLTDQNITGTQKQVAAIANNLKLMVTVLSKEILFSKLLTQLGTVTPKNVVLTNLSISQSEGAIDITAAATDYTAAAQLQANLTDPGNKIFSKADVVDINCNTNSSTGISAKYPCTTSVKALFADNNPFLFINADKADL